MLVDAAAERYATAVFELAKEAQKVQEVDKELRAATAIASSEPALARALIAPDIPEQVKRNIVQKVFGTRVSTLTLQFIQVLVDAERFAALADVASRFHGLMQDSEGAVQVDVETAVELGQDVKKKVYEQVAKHTGRDPVVHWGVDPELLGGVVVRIKDNIIDYSLKSQLHELRERLLRAQA